MGTPWRQKFIFGFCICIKKLAEKQLKKSSLNKVKGTVSRDFFENSQRYSRVKVHHRYRWHRRQIFKLFSLALLIPVANLPPVSMTPVATCHLYQRHRRQICHRCHWHRRQIMATISDCRHLKVNLKAKIYIYVYSTTHRCPNKIIKIFLLEGFFHLPPVWLTPVANLELRISPRIFE
jgi:hypothetical protein